MLIRFSIYPRASAIPRELGSFDRIIKTRIVEVRWELNQGHKRKDEGFVKIPAKISFQFWMLYPYSVSEVSDTTCWYLSKLFYRCSKKKKKPLLTVLQVTQYLFSYFKYLIRTFFILLKNFTTFLPFFFIFSYWGLVVILVNLTDSNSDLEEQPLRTCF